MGLVGCLLGTIGFGIGVLIGLFIGFLLFIYNEPADVKMTFNPFKEDNERFSGPLERYASNESSVSRLPIPDGSICGAGLLSVMIQRAEDVEGKYHHNPYALIIFKE
ncbi:hypothetical protein GOBAR_DD09610 [Gossypium barbadense]|nr:hypothetical protein GOBAR_DD09610 [Gossypium barbadense]